MTLGLTTWVTRQRFHALFGFWAATDCDRRVSVPAISARVSNPGHVPRDALRDVVPLSSRRSGPPSTRGCLLAHLREAAAGSSAIAPLLSRTPAGTPALCVGLRLSETQSWRGRAAERGRRQRCGKQQGN